MDVDLISSLKEVECFRLMAAAPGVGLDHTCHDESLCIEASFLLELESPLVRRISFLSS